MPVVSVKIPCWVEEKMKAYSQFVDWQEEIRRMLVSRVEELERAKAVDEAIGALGSVRPAPTGTARKLVRKDRDSH